MTNEEIPEVIQKFKDRHKQVKELESITFQSHNNAYIAAQTALGGEDGFDIERLNDAGTVDEFVKEMVKHYIGKVREKYGIPQDKELTEFDEHNLMQQYAGVTKSELTAIIKKEGSKYTAGEHGKLALQVSNSIAEKLQKVVNEDVKKEDIATFIEHAGAGDYLDPDKIKTDEVGAILYKQLYKPVPLTDYKNHIAYKQ